METGKQITQTKRFSLSTRFRPLLWLFPLSFLVVAFFYPLSRIFSLTFDASTLTSGNLLIAWRVFL